MTRSALTVALLCVALPVSAEVFKCTGPDGALTFSDKPCPGQATESINVTVVEPTDAQRKQAGEIAERDRKMIEPKAVEHSVDSADDSPKKKRPPLARGMTKQQVLRFWGRPDFSEGEMWGYHSEPEATVIFTLGGKVMSVHRNR